MFTFLPASGIYWSPFGSPFYSPAVINYVYIPRVISTPGGIGTGPRAPASSPGLGGGGLRPGGSPGVHTGTRGDFSGGAGRGFGGGAHGR